MVFGWRSPKPEIVLSFRADGPYWSDLIHLLAYPEDISYIWPFRYDARLVAPDVQKLFDHSKKLRGLKVIVGARFQTQKMDKFLPIREAIIVGADASSGIYSFKFRLRKGFNFVGATTLEACSVTIAQPVDHLAFVHSLATLPRQPVVAAQLGPSWKEFASLVAKENSLPINQDAVNSMYFHVSGVSTRHGDLRAKRIFKSWTDEDIYGYRLKQGQSFQLKFSYYVPALEGKNTTVQEIVIDPKLPTENVNKNTHEIKIIGNYGVETMYLGAAKQSTIYEKLALTPQKDLYIAQDQISQIKSHSFEIPLLVIWSFMTWLKRTVIPTVLLFISLVALGAANLLQSVFDKVADGTLTWEKLAAQWPLIAIIVVASGFASCLIPFLQASVNPK